MHETLQKIKKNKIDNVIIEASSHGLHQKRLEHLNIKAGIFTNFSQDHLDYHKTMQSYLNAKLIILPLFEASCLDQKSYNTLFKKITYLSKIALKNNINLIIECSLSVKKLINFLSSFLNKNVYHVFDTGNNYLLNKSKYQEVVSLGNFIQHIHIKDKNTHNQNVFLGTGSVNFNDFFLALKKINYKGVFIFETPIGKTPQNTALYNKCFCNFFINEIMLDN